MTPAMPPNTWLAGAGIACVLAAASCFAADGIGNYRDHGVGSARIVLDHGPWYPIAYERGEKLAGKVVLPTAGPERAMTLRVADSLGRLLLEKRLTAPAGKTEVPFAVAVPGVVAMRHYVTVAAADGSFGAGAEFLYTPPKAWDDYICTIWQRHNAKRIPYLQEMYLSGSQWSGSSSHLPEHFIDANYRYYVEGGAMWVFAAYHRWFPDREKTYYHKQAKKAFMADRTNFRILERNPCLSNPHIRERIQWIFTHEARMHRVTRPLYYTVSDEPGIANQAAPFDYCFSPYCKKAFRAWLKKRYGTLAAVNAEWGTDYKKWEDVRGATTDEIFARGDDNFSQWCDHKEFMDDVLIGGYALAKKYMRRHDPAGRIGMGGGQGPSPVGGWDFWKLAQVFDVMENYYIGNNYELMRSFAPNMIPFHCSFGRGNPEKHLIWYLFIHGDRGLLVWDDKSRYVTDDGKYSARAKEAKQWYKELTGGIGKLRIASQRTDDPIALYHSQANLRVHWVLEVRPSGKNWIRRDSWSERINSRYFRLRESWVKLIEDNGFQYKFICPGMVARGDLKPYDPKTGEGFKVLLLPEILSMSAAEVAAVRKFVRAGGTVIADKLPAGFDEHGKRRQSSPLAGLFEDGADGRAILLDRDMLPYYQQRILPGNKETALKNLIGEHLRKVVGSDRVTPIVTGPGGGPVTGVEVTVWRNGRAQLIALHRNPLLRVNELGPQEYKKNVKFEKPVKLTVRLPYAVAWFNVRTGQKLKAGFSTQVTLPPFEPVFLMAFHELPGKFQVDVADGRIRIAPARPCDLAKCVYHLDFIGPTCSSPQRAAQCRCRWR